MIASIELSHIAFNNIEVPLDYITGILVVLLPRRSKACCPSIGVALTPAWYCDWISFDFPVFHLVHLIV